ncbi:MAG: NTP transferase domain-containing protein [Betaproteobacteria bacterium]|nr:NTP transferase domain-containing protein [Betaproteobacteria bacterium]
MADNIAVGDMAAVILAAGDGSRVGFKPKGLLERDGQPLVARQIDLLADAGLRRIVVVLGQHAAAFEPVLERARASLPAHVRLEWVRNPAPQDGTGASLRCALARFESESKTLQAAEPAPAKAGDAAPTKGRGNGPLDSRVRGNDGILQRLSHVCEVGADQSLSCVCDVGADQSLSPCGRGIEGEGVVSESKTLQAARCRPYEGGGIGGCRPYERRGERVAVGAAFCRPPLVSTPLPLWEREEGGRRGGILPPAIGVNPSPLVGEGGAKRRERGWFHSTLARRLARLDSRVRGNDGILQRLSRVCDVGGADQSLSPCGRGIEGEGVVSESKTLQAARCRPYEGGGIEARAAPVSAIMVLLADQPLLQGEDIGAVLHAWSARPPGIELVVPTYQGQPGHPLVFGTALRRWLAQQPASVGVRDWRRAHPAQVLELPMPHPRCTLDIDTEADLAALAATHGVHLRWPDSKPEN